jgi:chemotaxis methyl-accepting protein methylase
MTVISRRYFCQYIALTTLGLIGCKSNRLGTLDAHQEKNGPSSYSLVLARRALDLDPLKQAIQQNAAGDESSQVTRRLYLIDNGLATDELRKAKEYDLVRTIIREGDFRVSYTAAIGLVLFPSEQGDVIIDLMLTQPQSAFEHNLGTLLLFLRLADEPASPISSWRGKIKRNLLYPSVAHFISFTGAIPDSKTVSSWKIDDITSLTEFCRQSLALPLLSEHLSSGQALVWDIGCSIGQGTISTLMHLSEARPGFPGRIVATDVNPFLLLYAQRALYELTAPSYYAQYGARVVTDEDLIRQHFQRNNWPIDHINRYFRSQRRSIDGKEVHNVNKSVLEKARYEYDDITEESSVVPDASIDAALYYNVHYILPDSLQEQAIMKILRKLKKGGLLFFQDPYQSKTIDQVKRYFGQPVNIVSGGEGRPAINVFRR